MQVFRFDNGNSSSSKKADAQEKMFFANELTNYEPTKYKELLSTLTSFQVFGIKPIPAHSKVHVYGMYKGTGESKYIAKETGKTKDVPYVGANGKQYTLTLQDLACAIAYSDSDIVADRATKKGMFEMLTNQAMRTNFELMNRTCFYGDSSLGLQGITTTPYSARKAVIANNWLAGGITPQEMYTDLLTGYNAVLTNTKNLIRPNLLLIAPSMYNAMNSGIFNDYNGLTVKQQIENAQTVRVISTPELEGAFDSGKDGFIFLNNSPEFIEHVVADMFSIKEPQPTGLEYISHCVSRHGGLVIRQPKCISLNWNTV